MFVEICCTQIHNVRNDRCVHSSEVYRKMQERYYVRIRITYTVYIYVQVQICHAPFMVSTVSGGLFTGVCVWCVYVLELQRMINSCWLDTQEKSILNGKWFLFASATNGAVVIAFIGNRNGKFFIVFNYTEISLIELLFVQAFSMLLGFFSYYVRKVVEYLDTKNLIWYICTYESIENK